MTSLVVADSATVNTLDVTYAAPDTFGTVANGDPATLKTYKVTCSPTSGNASLPAITRTFTTLGPNKVGGLAVGAFYTCSVVVVNSDSAESTPVTAAAVQVA